MPDRKVMLAASTDKYGSEDFDTYLKLKVDRHEMLDLIPEGASIILDVGCAIGGFGEILKSERSCEVWGVEINEQAASVAAQKLDKVICGAFDKSIDLPINKFDCIIFNDVLEHLIDPYSALLHAKTLLRTGGKVIASIPNVRYFDNIWKLIVNRDWEYTQHGILDRTHLRFFTRRSIVRTFKDLNYNIESIKGINSLNVEHPHHWRKFRIINFIVGNRIEDMRYLQFAVVASPDCPINSVN
jgi:2-polyprenyl-3-methyl-5-hydroxy-6-metoxy-1,4-benzoquinol methylase